MIKRQISSILLAIMVLFSGVLNAQDKRHSGCLFQFNFYFLRIENLNMTDNEKDAVIAFLHTLTGEAVYTDEKWSDR